MTWSVEFMLDTLINGRRFRTLNIVDDFNRQTLSIKVDFSFPCASVVRSLVRTIHEQGKPMQIRSDNGPEFIRKGKKPINRWTTATTKVP